MVSRSPNYPSRLAFSPRDRLLLYTLAGGRCQLCGVELTLAPGLPNSLIAGHVVARSENGGNHISNGRAECRDCSCKDGFRRQASIIGRRRDRQRPAAPPWQDPSIPVAERERLYWEHVAQW